MVCGCRVFQCCSAIAYAAGCERVLARYGEIKKAVALSPGLEYLGVSAENAISKIKNNLLLVASADDDYSYKSVKQLNKLNPRTEIKLYDDAGHATNMFSKYPELMDEIIDWLK